MSKKNQKREIEIPMGLSMAMSKNPKAMDYFSSLDLNGKQQVINAVHGVQSKEQMKEFVSNMADSSKNSAGVKDSDKSKSITETAITDSPEDPYNGIYM